MSVWLQGLSWEIWGGSSSHQFPFHGRTALQNSQKHFLHPALPSAFRLLFCHKGNTNFCWGNGGREARFMHRFPFPTSLCKILWTGSLLTGPGKWWDLTQRCLLSTSLLLVQLFLVSQSLQQLVTDLSLCSALSLEASSSQCHEKRDCLLCAAPFAPTGSHQLPLSQHQRHPRLAREQILLWVSSKVLCSW